MTSVPIRQFSAMNFASSTRSRMQPWEVGRPNSLAACACMLFISFASKGREWNM